MTLQSCQFCQKHQNIAIFELNFHRKNLSPPRKIDFFVLYCEAGRIAGFQFYRFTGIERHSFARPFLIHDYAMNRGTQSSDRGIVSNLGDPLWYLPDGVVNLEEKCFSARDMTC